MSPRWFVLEAIFWKLWPYLFFLTAHNFANGPHFVALTQLRATKTGSKICCTQSTMYIFWILSELGFRGYLPRKIFGTERFTKKFRFSLISLSLPPKKYWACVPTILMPPTLPILLAIASFNHYTPNFSGGGPKSWPGVIDLASCALQRQPIRNVVLILGVSGVL